MAVCASPVILCDMSSSIIQNLSSLNFLLFFQYNGHCMEVFTIYIALENKGQKKLFQIKAVWLNLHLIVKNIYLL